MGQYYHPINLDKREHLYSHDYNSGLKLMEHSWLENNFVKAVCIKLCSGNSWAGNRIIWAGDYSDYETVENPIYLDSEQIEIFDKEQKKYRNDDGTLNINPYDLCYDPKYDEGDWTENMKRVAFTKAKKNDDDYLNYLVHRFLINLDKSEYVDLTKLPHVNGWVVHPLPLLTCISNGRGGGDYHPNGHEEEYIGSWAGDRIVLSKIFHPGFVEIVPNFYEKSGNENVIFFDKCLEY